MDHPGQLCSSSPRTRAKIAMPDSEQEEKNRAIMRALLGELHRNRAPSHARSGACHNLRTGLHLARRREMTVRQIGQLLRTGKLSCVELTEQTLADIKKREVFRSFITRTEEQALNEARERDQELRAARDRGPFHGIPIAHKDLFYTRGIRTTGGSLVFKDFVPDYDATVVKRLKAAGAICLGKTNLHELAYGVTSKNPHYGFVLNPRDTSRIAGGSSGGSAALVAGGFLPMATGTDTGGSIRIPASFCGVVGLKPTYGLASRYGVLPLSFSLDHVGPIGSCVEDCGARYAGNRRTSDSNTVRPPL